VVGAQHPAMRYLYAAKAAAFFDRLEI